MSRGMVSFLAGFGGGMIEAKDKALKEARQKKLDERADWEFDQRKTAADEAARLKSDLKDAAAPRATMQGTITETADNKYLNADPAQASAMQKMLADEAEMKGGPAPTQQAGTGIVGHMARGNEITTGPVDTAKLNDPGARNERVLGALQQNGQVERALSMENTILDQSAKRLGLKTAELKFADDEFNRKLTDTFASNPNWTEAASKVLTDTQVGGLAGMTVTPKLSADGKTVDFVGAGADGKTKTLATLPNTDEGKAKFMAQVMRAPAEVKIGFLVEQAKAAKEDSRWQQTFDFNKKKEENDQQYRQRMLGLQQAQEGRARQVHAIAMEDAKIPPAVKLQAQTLAKQMEAVGSALNKAMAEGLFDPNNPNSSKLIETQSMLQLKYAQLLKPYTPGSDKGADPLGLNGAPPAAQPGTAPAASPAPAVQQQAAAPPVQPTAPPPTMDQIQAQTRANRERIAQQAEADRRLESEPVMQALRQQHAQAIRAGNAVEANAIMGRINEARQRYAAQ